MNLFNAGTLSTNIWQIFLRCQCAKYEIPDVFLKLVLNGHTYPPGTFTNHFWESKLPSIPFNIESPAMRMVPSGHLFGVSLD